MLQRCFWGSWGLTASPATAARHKARRRESPYKVPSHQWAEQEQVYLLTSGLQFFQQMLSRVAFLT